MNRKQIKKINRCVAVVFACFIGISLGSSLVEVLVITAMYYWLFWGILYYSYARKSLFLKWKKEGYRQRRDIG